MRATRLDRRRVQVQWDDSHVRILDPLAGNLLREHLRQQRGRHRIQDEDRPSKTSLSTRLLLARCEKVGRHIGAFCQGLHRRHGEVAVRRILGVLSMAKKYGVASAEDAFGLALETGAEYPFVRRYLEHHPQLPLNLRCVRSIRSSDSSRCTAISFKPVLSKTQPPL